MLDAPELASSLGQLPRVRPARLRPVAEAALEVVREDRRPLGHAAVDVDARGGEVHGRLAAVREARQRVVRVACRDADEVRRAGAVGARRASTRTGRCSSRSCCLLRTRPPFPAAKTKSVSLHGVRLDRVADRGRPARAAEAAVDDVGALGARVVDRVDDRAPGQAPEAFAARTGMIETSQLTPAMSAPLLPSAPIVPATCVPWPLKSSGVLSFWMKSQPRVSSIFPLPSSSTPFGGSSFVQMLSFSSGWS